MALVMLNYWVGWGEKKNKFLYSLKSSIVDDPKSSIHTFMLVFQVLLITVLLNLEKPLWLIPLEATYEILYKASSQR